MGRISGPLNRISVIDILEKQHNVSRVITESLCHYMENTKRYQEGNLKTKLFRVYYLN